MMLEAMLDHIGNNAILLLSVGLLAGLLHAFEPDHVAAVMTQLRHDKGDGRMPDAGFGAAALKNSMLGAVWGFGHMSMILLVSVLVFVLAVGIPAALFDGFELAVGLMLVVLGISMCGRNIPYQNNGHSHPHSHPGGITHTHPHSHDNGHSHTHRSYIIGCLHGLAGSGILIAAGAASLTDMSGLFAFVLVFGAGMILGMMAASGILSVPFRMFRGHVRAGMLLRALAGAATICIGLVIIYGLAESGGISAFLDMVGHATGIRH